MTEWFDETLHEGIRYGYRADNVLFDSETGHQRLVLIDNARFGRMLLLDSAVQTTEADEFIYHEMMAHTPIFAHGAAKNVLIIGGGDGGMLEEVCKHSSVESVTMVEIDESVVAFSRKWLPALSNGAFDDPRLDLVIDDGLHYVETTDSQFDVIIVDSTDPVGPGEVLFSDRFYKACHDRLAKDGILAIQNGVPFVQAEELQNTAHACETFFGNFRCYLATIPSYAGGPMAFGFAVKTTAPQYPTLDQLTARFSKQDIDGLKYYSPEIHVAAFVLPHYIQDIIRASRDS